jgi:hypothetical protein
MSPCLKLSPRGAAAPGAGDGVVVVDEDVDLAAVGEAVRLRKLDLQPCIGDDGGGLGFGSDERLHLNGVEQVAFRVVAARRASAAAGEGTGAGVLAVDVLLEIQPERGERVGRVVGVGDDLGAGEGLGGGVDLRVEVVVCQ